MKKSITIRIIPLSLILFLIINSGFSPQSNNKDEKIATILSKITSQLIEIRRDIHAHPELGFQEKRTAEIVANNFRKFGLEVRTNIGQTGVVGILKGGKPGGVVGFRADMDALPITEETGLPFASKVKITKEGKETGVMHACGHDIHTTILIGTAWLLSQMREEIPGTVVFYAQPAEEINGGALGMIADGALKNPSPSAILAYHVSPELNTGQIGVCPGYMAANIDSFRAVIKGRGGHGSQPHKTIDPIVIASRIVIALQLIVSREIDVSHHTVISVGTFHAGTASNIIPEEATISATIRTLAEEQREIVKEKIIRTIKGICTSAGAPEPEINYSFNLPAPYNDPELVEKITPTLKRVLEKPEDMVIVKPAMVGEDFCYFGREKPAVMLWLGCAKEGEPYYPLHNPRLNPDEKCIPLGVKLMSTLLLDYLNKENTEY
jgi:amidohydrolase